MQRPLVAAVAAVLIAIPGALAASPLAGHDTPRPANPGTQGAARTGPRGPGRGATAPAAPRPGSEPGTLTFARRSLTADSVVVEKAMRRLTIYAGGLPLRAYDVALGRTPSGAKERIGDSRTPEGLYFINARNPASQYHRGLQISYPNADDVARARAQGFETGGDIMIHGLPNGQGSFGLKHRAQDWTQGCVAVTNEEIEEIWDAVPLGTPVRIKP